MDNWRLKLAQGKILIDDNFKDIIQEVDIKTEELLIKLNNETPIDQQSIDRLNEGRQVIINKINEIRRHHMDTLSVSNSQQMFDNSLKRFCVYFPVDYFDGILINERTNGVLLVTDFYFTNVNRNFLK